MAAISELKKRVVESVPEPEESKKFMQSVAVAILGRAPTAVINGAFTIALAEKMRDDQGLMMTAIALYALFNTLYHIYDYRILRSTRVGSLIKANVVFRALDFVYPKHDKVNAIGAEIGSTVLNLVGIDPDLSAPAATVASLVTGDPSFLVAQKMSDMVVSGAVHLPFAMYLKRSQDKKMKNLKQRGMQDGL